MKKEIEKEVINCSRCGLCMEVCPVYKAKKTETSVSRGKFLQLLGLIRGDLKMNKKIAYNLDLCLACGKCKKACPSNIDAVKIFSSIKEEYQTPFEKLFYSAPSFKLKMFFLQIMYKIKYPLGRKFKKKPFCLKTNEKIAYFEGCATRSIGNGFLSNIKKEKFSCCALPYYIKGRFDLYEKYKKRNIEIIKKYDKIVFDCATCLDTVSNYEGVEKEKLVYFTDFYKSKKLSLKEKTKITFHKPCHLSEEKFLEIEEILKNIENLEYVRMEEAFECCGFGGDFFTRHMKTASVLSKKKIENACKTGADIILTTCPTCLWSLKYGIKTLPKSMREKIKAYDISEFLQGNFFIS